MTEEFDYEEIKREAVAAAEQHEAFSPSDIPDNDYVEFVINTTRRTVKQENSLIRQILYTGLSKDTADPNNLMVSAPTSEGKTWPVIEVLKFFPKEDVLYIGKMSTMSLVRQKGILMDSNNEPVKDRIRQLKKQISKSKDDNEKEALEDELDEIICSDMPVIPSMATPTLNLTWCLNRFSFSLVLT